jgi:hypothetical protein
VASSSLGVRLFVVLRDHLPGVYSMGQCDGRQVPDASLGALGDGRAPSRDLPLSEAAAAAAVGVAVLLLLRARRGRGEPPTLAGAAP